MRLGGAVDDDVDGGGLRGPDTQCGHPSTLPETRRRRRRAYLGCSDGRLHGARRAGVIAPGRGTAGRHRPGRPADRTKRRRRAGRASARRSGCAELQERLWAESRDGGDAQPAARPAGHRHVRQGRRDAARGRRVRRRSACSTRRSGRRRRRSCSTTSSGGSAGSVPGPGMIGVFDRSHYEDVLVPLCAPHGRRVRDRAAVHARSTRSSRSWPTAGVTVLKCFLHISSERQRQRLLKRLDRPDKRWKFHDVRPRRARAVAEVPGRVPGDAARTPTPTSRRGTSCRATTRATATGRSGGCCCETLEDMDPRYPQPDLDVPALKARLPPARPDPCAGLVRPAGSRRLAPLRQDLCGAPQPEYAGQASRLSTAWPIRRGTCVRRRHWRTCARSQSSRRARHGVFTVRGGARWRLDGTSRCPHGVAAGRIDRLDRGVYGACRYRATIRTRCARAVRGTRPWPPFCAVRRSAATHRSAAVLAGLPIWTMPDRACITVPPRYTGDARARPSAPSDARSGDVLPATCTRPSRRTDDHSTSPASAASRRPP